MPMCSNIMRSQCFLLATKHCFFHTKQLLCPRRQKSKVKYSLVQAHQLCARNIPGISPRITFAFSHDRPVSIGKIKLVFLWRSADGDCCFLLKICIIFFLRIVCTNSWNLRPTCGFSEFKFAISAPRPEWTIANLPLYMAQSNRRTSLTILHQRLPGYVPESEWRDFHQESA